MRADGRDLPWDDVIAGFVEPVEGSCVEPNREHHALYARLIETYAACEAHALGRGPDPTPLLTAFR
jgi:hypothetical protein